MASGQENYDLLFVTKWYIGCSPNGAPRIFAHIPPVEAAVLSLLSTRLDPLARAVLSSKAGSPGYRRCKKLHIRLPGHSLGDIRASNSPPPQWDGRLNFYAWSYYATDVDYISYGRAAILRDEYRPVPRDPEYFSDPEALYALICDENAKYDSILRLRIDAISKSADSTRLALSILRTAQDLRGWLAFAAARILTPSAAAEFFDLKLYIKALGPPDDALERLYVEASMENFRMWAMVLLPTLLSSNLYATKALNDWAQDPVCGKTLTAIYSIVTKPKIDKPDMHNELKLIPLLRNVCPAMVFLFALDLSAGPLLEHAISGLGEIRGPLMSRYRDSKPLRNLFFTELKTPGAIADRRSEALRDAIRRLDTEDLQAALDAALTYRADRKSESVWGGDGFYYETVNLCMRWDLVDFAMLENPGLLIRMPPPNRSAMEYYLRLYEPAPAMRGAPCAPAGTLSTQGPSSGRIKIRGRGRLPEDLTRIQYYYRQIRGGDESDVVRDYWKIADWYGFDRGEFQNAFLVWRDWVMTLEAFRRLLEEATL